MVFLTLLIYSIYFIYRYRERNNEGSRSNTSTFYLLLDLLTFFDSYHEGNVDEAFEVHRIFLVYNFCNFFFKDMIYLDILYLYVLIGDSSRHPGFFCVGDEAVKITSLDS